MLRYIPSVIAATMRFALNFLLLIFLPSSVCSQSDTITNSFGKIYKKYNLCINYKYIVEKQIHDYSNNWDFDKDGKLIRRVVNKVVRYHEISLVHHGADPYAQKIKDGQINTPLSAEVS